MTHIIMVYLILMSALIAPSPSFAGGHGDLIGKSVCIASPMRRLRQYSFSGRKYMTVESNNKFVTATRTHCGQWEVFRIKGNTIYNPFWKTYLSCQPDGRLEGNRKQAGAWEQIEIVRLNGKDAQENQLFALRCLAHNKPYLVIEGGNHGPIKANRSAVGPWEQFTITWVCDNISQC